MEMLDDMTPASNSTTDRFIMCRDCELTTLHFDMGSDLNRAAVEDDDTSSLRFKCKACGAYNQIITVATEMTFGRDRVYNRLDTFVHGHAVGHDPFVQLELLKILGELFDAIRQVEKDVTEILEQTMPLPGEMESRSQQ